MSEEWDPVIDDIRETLREISMEMTQVRADYERASMNGDDASRRAALRQLGAYQTEYANAVNYGNQYWASKQPPPAPPELSAEEKAAKPLSHCNWSDTYEWAKNSKYGVDDDAFRAGMAEVNRRRRAGE